MMLYTVAIVLAHAVLAVHGMNPFKWSSPADDIGALCAGKSVALYSLSELEHLNSIVGAVNCSSTVKAAIPDLLTLIKQTQANLCAPESIDKLREFYSKHLDTSNKENKQREELPKSLKKFALAYGMQMSSVCKRIMLSTLTKHGQQVLNNEAHKAIKSLVAAKSPVAEMLEGLVGPDTILLPGDLAPYIKDKQQAEPDDDDDIIYVQSATGPYIRQMQDNCNQKFAPIYKPLIRPVVRLANMGFNYIDTRMRAELEHAPTSEFLARWARLVFLCESLNNIRLVDVQHNAQQPEDAEGAKERTRDAVRILTKDEAAAIEGTSASELRPRVIEREWPPVVIRPELIVNIYDHQLKKAIKAFSTSKSENEKAAKRMMGRGISMLKSQLKRGKFGLFFSTGYKSLLHRIRTGEKLKPSDEIVKLLDGAIGRESTFEDVDDSNANPSTKWEGAKELASDIGSFLVNVLVVIVVFALWALMVAAIVLGLIAIFTG